MKRKGTSLLIYNFFEFIFLYGIGGGLVICSLVLLGKGVIWGVSGFAFLGLYYFFYSKICDFLVKILSLDED